MNLDKQTKDFLAQRFTRMLFECSDSVEVTNALNELWFRITGEYIKGYEPEVDEEERELAHAERQWELKNDK